MSVGCVVWLLVPPTGRNALYTVVSGSDKTKRWPKAGRSSAPAFFKGFGITANASSVCDVKNGHTPKFAMKHGFFVFKAEGREIILKYF